MVLRFDVNSACQIDNNHLYCHPYPERRQLVYLQFSLELIALDRLVGMLVYLRVLTSDDHSAELDLFKFLKICNGGATVNWNAILQDGFDKGDVRVSQSASISSPITSRDISQDVEPFSSFKYNIVNTSNNSRTRIFVSVTLNSTSTTTVGSLGILGGSLLNKRITLARFQVFRSNSSKEVMSERLFKDLVPFDYFGTIP
ncbi:UNVERIFIED_CONTAM: hypothetical protein NCL1_13652 [Trichonephila clavipes]